MDHRPRRLRVAGLENALSSSCCVGLIQPTQRSEWRDLIAALPGRFLSALDLGQDRLHRIAEYDQKHRDFLTRLPERSRHEVGYRNAWKLLFNEEFA